MNQAPLPIDVYLNGKWLTPAERNELSISRMHWFSRLLVRISYLIAPNWKPK